MILLLLFWDLVSVALASWNSPCSPDSPQTHRDPPGSWVLELWSRVPVHSFHLLPGSFDIGGPGCSVLFLSRNCLVSARRSLPRISTFSASICPLPEVDSVVDYQQSREEWTRLKNELKGRTGHFLAVRKESVSLWCPDYLWRPWRLLPKEVS